MSNTAYLSLGSNIGDRESHLREAIRRLEDLGTVKAASSFYDTEPVDVVDQPRFLNCAVVLGNAAEPWGLMQDVLSIEQQMGRRRTRTKGPRIIDIDILLFDERLVDTPELRIPHPAMHERRFVLEPLAEIAPEVPHPLLKKTVRELLSSLPAGQTVRRLPNRQSKADHGSAIANDQRQMTDD